MEFEKLGIEGNICQILSNAGITSPTPIQAQAIPEGLSGKDVIGLAQTGTGKTLSFALPIIQQMLKSNGNALVVVPTRELAFQVEESFRLVSQKLKQVLTSTVLVGGVPMDRQTQKLRRNPRIVIATPGRLQDHIRRRTFNVRAVKFFVLDEADRMFDIGFAPQIKQVIAVLPKEKQSMLFSATMPTEIENLAKQFLVNPVRIQIATPGTTAKEIRQELCMVMREGKMDILQKILAVTNGLTLIFARTKFGAKALSQRLQKMGYTSNEIHSNRSLSQRKEALDGFKKFKYQILVATDIAARGIDVNDIELVINYDLPEAAEDYVHRIGRTGRAGKKGLAITLASPDQSGTLRQIERLPGVEFIQSEHTLKHLEVFRQNAPQVRSRRQGSGSSQRGGSSRGGSSRGGNSRGGNSRGGNSRHNRSGGRRFSSSGPRESARQ